MSVRVASTTNIATLSGLLTVDGVTVSAGDLVLLKDQTTGTQNGVYVASASAWSRDTNLLATGSNAYNILIYVRNGTVNSGNTYQCTSSPGVVGTNALVFWLYNNNMYLYWASAANGNPLTGQQLNGTIGGSASYSSALDGVQLTTGGTNQTGYLNWNLPGFDFTKDFQLSVCFFQNSGGGDGVFFGVGSSAGTGIFAASGGLAFEYYTYSGGLNDQFYINGTGVGNVVGFHTGVTYLARRMTTRMVVKTFGTSRIAFIYTGSCNSADNSYDVTSWNPIGSYIYVGARSGSSTSTQYVNMVSLEYI